MNVDCLGGAHRCGLEEKARPLGGSELDARVAGKLWRWAAPILAQTPISRLASAILAQCSAVRGGWACPVGCAHRGADLGGRFGVPLPPSQDQQLALAKVCAAVERD